MTVKTQYIKRTIIRRKRESGLKRILKSDMFALLVMGSIGGIVFCYGLSQSYLFR